VAAMSRRFVAVILAIVFVDVFLQFAIVPLLPEFSDVAGLSKTQAGLIVAAYSGAVLLASFPVGRLADRVGPRKVTIFGVVLLTGAIILNTVASDFATLFAVRLGQGVSSAISWTAGLAWLTGSVTPEKRARALTSAMTAATLGALLGPVISGPIAQHWGLHAPYVVFAVVTAALSLAALTLPEAHGHVDEPASLREVAEIVRGGGMLSAALIVILIVAVVSGVIETLIPLALGQEGYSAVVISAVLAATGLLAVLTNTAVGTVYNRFGGVAIGVAAAATASLGCVLMSIPAGAAAVAVIYVVFSPAITAQYAVCFPLATEGADRTGLTHGVVMGATNVVWGLGFLVGPAAGAAVAEATSDRVSYLAAAAISLAGAAWLRSLALSPVECQDGA
jgi:MFS transporter, DHA1 family, solute carrier family 18 (vesicular amine transporter), member 1/2